MTDGARAIIYRRVSSDAQAESGLGLESQERVCRAYCSMHGLEIVGVSTDAGLSGALESRPALDDALESIRDGAAGHLVVAKLDRLTRSVRHLLRIVEVSRGESWHLHSVSERIDTDSAMGRFFLSIMGALSQMERELIGERTKAALAAKRARGEKLGGPVPAWRQLPGILAHVQRLRDAGLSWGNVCTCLNTGGRWARPDGRAWSRSTVARMGRAQERSMDTERKEHGA